MVIGRDHFDCASAASTEAVQEGSDAIAAWPLLNALLNTASGATWVSIHHEHTGQVTVADGTDEMARRIERVLTSDSGIGIARHVDAGDAEARDFARRAGVKIPMIQD